MSESKKSQNASRAIGIVDGFIRGFVADRDRGIAQEWERYRNEMRNITSGMEQDVLTQKEAFLTADNRSARVASRIGGLQGVSQSVLRTAVQGFSGRTARALQRTAVQAAEMRVTAIDEQERRQLLNIDNQRLNIAMNNTLSQEDGWVAPTDWMGIMSDSAANAIAMFSGGGKPSGSGGEGGK